MKWSHSSPNTWLKKKKPNLTIIILCSSNAVFCLPWSWTCVISAPLPSQNKKKKRFLIKIPLPLVGKTVAPPPNSHHWLSQCCWVGAEYCFDSSTVFTKESTYRWLTYSCLWILSRDSTKRLNVIFKFPGFKTHTIWDQQSTENQHFCFTTHPANWSVTVRAPQWDHSSLTDQIKKVQLAWTSS